MVRVLRIPQAAVELAGIGGGHGEGQRVAGEGLGLDRLPQVQIGACLDHVALAGFAPQDEVECI